MSKMVEYIRLLRPSQWYKNFLIPAVGIFAIEVFDVMIYLYLILGFLSACGIAGFNYLINDILDSESDRVHPEKKKRPIASGVISKKVALLFGTLILISSLVCSVLISFWFFLVMVLFLLVAQLYNIILKKIAFVDILTISMNFIIRGLGGFAIILTYVAFDFGPILWPAWAVFILALFLAISKRKADLQLIERPEAQNHKNVYDKYQKQLLDQLVLMIATILLMGYYLWVLFNDATGGYLLLTIPVATYLMFRYLYLLNSPEKAIRTPEKAIKDPGILISSIIVLILYLLIRYLDSFGII